jgi:serine/threonine protein kinase
LEFDPEDWTVISDEAKDLITKMLVKDPSQRISVVACLEHPWFEKVKSIRNNSAPNEAY